MSQYTTKVRYVCETFAGLDESGGFNDIDETIEKSYDKIFGDYPIFDEAYRPTLEKFILYQYYDREICCDTVALWQHFLTKNLRRIMPLYNQYFESELLLKGVNLLNDVNITTDRKIERENVADSKTLGKTSTDTNINTSENTETNQDFNGSTNTTLNKNTTTTDTVDNLHWDVHSDTPQGTVSDLDSGKYMNDARKITDKNTNTRVNSGSDNDETNSSGGSNVNHEGESKTESKTKGEIDNTSNTKENGVESYFEKLSGTRTGTLPEKVMLLRKSFMNINSMIADELSNCFYQFY